MINELGDFIREIAYEHYKNYWETDQDSATNDRQYDRIEMLKAVADILDPRHSYDFESAYGDEKIYRWEQEEYLESLEGNPLNE